VGPVRTRLQAAAVCGLTRLVGRDQEVDHLHQALRWARTGHGQVMALAGEPGVGKSRLVEECLQSSRRQGWRALESASVSYGKATQYFPSVDLLRRYQHSWGGKTYDTQLRLNPLSPTSAAALLQALLGDDPNLAPLTPLRIKRTEGRPFFLDLEYTFKHALTHKVAYGNLLQEQRRTLHGRIVDALEQPYPDRVEQFKRLAHHTLRGEHWDKAVEYGRRAGAKAGAWSANGEAAAYDEQALAALAHQPTSLDMRAQAIYLGYDLASRSSRWATASATS
jgi:predicted ATPase